MCACACEYTYTNVCGNLRKNTVSCKAARTIYLLANTKFHFSRAVDGVRLNHTEHRRGIGGRARGRAGLPWERRLSLKECGESVGPALPGQARVRHCRGVRVSPGCGWQLGGRRSRGQWEGCVPAALRGLSGAVAGGGHSSASGRGRQLAPKYQMWLIFSCALRGVFIPSGGSFLLNSSSHQHLAEFVGTK